MTYNIADSHIDDMEASTDYQVITNFIIHPGYYDKPDAVFKFSIED